MATSVDRGRRAESLAAAFLSLLGYRIRDRNVRMGPLELDLIAEKDDVLAVVEVKFRAAPTLGGAPGAVTAVKARRLETAAVRYLLARGLEGRRIRFDVILVETLDSGRGVTLRHIPGAFPASGRYRL